MRSTTFASGLMAAGLVLSQAAGATLVMSAPPALVAGSGSTLLLRFASLGDRDPSTLPVASVDGMDIRVDLRDECVEISCDVLDDHFFRVDLPPLAEGEYTVNVYGMPDSEDARGSFTLTVGPEAALPLVLPSEGFWKPVGMSGTGLHVQHRGDLLAVSQFDQVEGDATWRLDAVPLHGDSAIVLLREYAGGSCLGCEPYVPPTVGDVGTAMRITFESARTATAELVDGTVVPLVNLAFGAEYLDVDLAADDEAFGSLALPDLSGSWAIPRVRQDIITLGAAELQDDGSVVFSSMLDDGLGSVVVQCTAATPDGAAGCVIADHCCSPPLIAFAPLGDVGEERIHFRFQSVDESFFAVRIPDDGVEATMPPRPAEGFWTIPGQSGTGMHFQQRGELLAVSEFDFVDGNPHWRLGVAPLAMAGAQVALHSYSGGSCFGCTPHVAPVADSEPPVATIVFDSARRANVQLDDGTVVALVNLAFGAGYVDLALPGAGDDAFGPLALPDLSGTWAFDLGLDSGMPFPEIVTLQGPTNLGNAVVFARDDAEGERFELVCAAGGEFASGCELHMGDLVFTSPPPGLIPFAPLGDIESDRMRFSRGRPGDSRDDWRVFYAVRIPPGR